MNGIGCAASIASLVVLAYVFMPLALWLGDQGLDIPKAFVLVGYFAAAPVVGTAVQLWWGRRKA
jgi:hypothetical protein